MTQRRDEHRRAVARLDLCEQLVEPLVGEPRDRGSDERDVALPRSLAHHREPAVLDGRRLAGQRADLRPAAVARDETARDVRIAERRGECGEPLLRQQPGERGADREIARDRQREQALGDHRVRLARPVVTHERRGEQVRTCGVELRRRDQPRLEHRGECEVAGGEQCGRDPRREPVARERHELGDESLGELGIDAAHRIGDRVERIAAGSLDRRAGDRSIDHRDHDPGVARGQLIECGAQPFVRMIRDDFCERGRHDAAGLVQVERQRQRAFGPREALGELGGDRIGAQVRGEAGGAARQLARHRGAAHIGPAVKQRVGVARGRAVGGVAQRRERRVADELGFVVEATDDHSHRGDAATARQHAHHARAQLRIGRAREREHRAEQRTATIHRPRRDDRELGRRGRARAQSPEQLEVAHGAKLSGRRGYHLAYRFNRIARSARRAHEAMCGERRARRSNRAATRSKSAPPARAGSRITSPLLRVPKSPMSMARRSNGPKAPLTE